MQIPNVKHHKCQAYIALETSASIFACLARHWSVNAAKRITSTFVSTDSGTKASSFDGETRFKRERGVEILEIETSREHFQVKSSVKQPPQPPVSATLAKPRHVVAQIPTGCASRALIEPEHARRKAHHAKVICRCSPHAVNAGQILTLSYFRRPSV